MSVVSPATPPHSYPLSLGRERCIISYGIWGNDDWASRVRQNIALARVFYPGWTLRIYHDRSISPGMLAKLRANNTEVRPLAPLRPEPGGGMPERSREAGHQRVSGNCSSILN